MPSETHRRLLRAKVIIECADGLPLSLDELHSVPCIAGFPDDTCDPPRDAEGMLIGWPAEDEISEDGLDPDGPLVPMRPAWWHEVAAGATRIAEAKRRDARDAALIAAIGKLWG